MMDPLSRLAMARAEAAAADIEAQLVITAGQRPVLVMLQMAKKEAVDAFAALVTADPEDPKQIRKLQNEIVRFTDLCRWLKDVVAAGQEAEQLISEEDREEMIEILSRDTEGQQELMELGLLNGDHYGTS
jgi:predicted class III extradiol MEMO1 family dioxygenase